MKKYRSYSVFQKTLSALLCLSMVLSVVTGTGLPELFNLTESVDAAEETSDPNEYKDETLEHMWDSDGDGDPTDEKYWNTARSYYACAATSEENAKKGAFQNWGGVYKRTIFHVYAFEGETICLGSSIYNSGLDLQHKLLTSADKKDSSGHYIDKGSVDIVMTDLRGNQIPIGNL